MRDARANGLLDRGVCVLAIVLMLHAHAQCFALRMMDLRKRSNAMEKLSRQHLKIVNRPT
jgi:hypothetical protein